jgi:signal transduction histidine kinase
MMTPMSYRDRRPALKTFLAALWDPHTYNPRKNALTLFGLLWGLPLSAFSVFLDLWVIGHPYRLALFWREPMHFVFLLHPFLFGIVFGAMGTVHQGQDRKIAELLEDQRRHVEELATANKELKKLDLLKAQFMANVTHELKTPLVAIKGYNESILEGRFGPLTPKQRQGLSIAVRNVGRLEKLVHELLEFERIESHAYTPLPCEFDLVGLVQLVLSNFQPQIDEKHLAVDVRLPDALPVRADYEGIRRVLLNLLSNAVKFSFEGGAFGVDAQVSAETRRARIMVWDRGPGIPSEVQPFLFTRFWQADGSSRRRHGGTGLGLAIVKGILDAHGSGVQAVSLPGSGTRIHFDLPVVEVQSVSKEAAHEDGTAAHSARG